MLILTRKTGQKIYIGDNKEVVLTVLGWNEHGVIRLGFDADISIPIMREEVVLRDNNNEAYPYRGQNDNRS